MRAAVIILCIVASVFLLAVLGAALTFTADLGHDCQQAQNC
jgi:hypothetical protein